MRTKGLFFGRGNLTSEEQWDQEGKMDGGNQSAGHGSKRGMGLKQKQYTSGGAGGEYVCGLALYVKERKKQIKQTLLTRSPRS